MEPKADRPSLVGLWVLIKYWVRFEADGRVVYPLGEDAKGYIYYSADGFTSGIMLRAGRVPFKTGDRLGADPAEKVSAWDSCITYCGFWEMEKEDLLVHKIRASLYPNWSGQDQYRYLRRLENGQIELTNSIEERGIKRTAVAQWRRAEPRDFS